MAMSAGARRKTPRGKVGPMSAPGPRSKSDYDDDDDDVEEVDEYISDSESDISAHVSPVRSTYSPKLLTPKARRAIFSLSPKLSTDTVFTPAQSAALLDSVTVTDQSLASIVRFIDTYWPLGENMGPDAALYIASQFLMGGRSYDTHVRAMASRVAALGPVFATGNKKYVLDNAKPVVTRSSVSPRLHFAKLGNVNMQQLIDWNERIVVKMYELGKLVNDAGRLIELATDVMIGAALGDMLVMNARYVVSPHMTFQLDWFPGPSISVKASPGATEPKRLFIATEASQYVVVERADQTLQDFLTSGRATPQVMRSCLWQLLYTLDAACETGDYAHGDLHPGNVMVRDLVNEPASPYLDKHWLYVRSHKTSGGPPVAIVTDHDNMFVELIDYGRSRLYCPIEKTAPDVTEGTDARRVLLGSDELVEFGIHSSQAYLDRSWDMRRLCTYLLRDYDLNRYDTMLLPVTTRTAARNLKELLVVGSNLVYFVLFVLDNINVYRVDLARDTRAMQYASLFEARMGPLYKQHFEAHREAIVVERTYVPPHDVAVALYNLYQGITESSNAFSERLESDMLQLTLGPNPDFTADELLRNPPSSPPANNNNNPAGSASPMSMSPGSPSEPPLTSPSSMHRTVSAGMLLGLPLFAALEAPAEIDAVLVGLVSAKAGAWKAPLGIAPAPTATAFNANVATSTVAATVECAVCRKSALGYAVDAHNQPTTARDVAFCSGMCMNIHMGVIRSVLPY